MNAQEKQKKQFEFNWCFLAIKKKNLMEHIKIANSKDKDTIIKILDDLKYDLLYNFEKNKKDQLEEFNKYNNAGSYEIPYIINNYQNHKAGCLERITRCKEMLLSGIVIDKIDKIDKIEYDIVRDYYIQKNTYYLLSKSWHMHKYFNIYFSRDFLYDYLIQYNEYMKNNNFFENSNALYEKIPFFKYENKYFGDHDYCFIGDINKDVSKDILQGNIIKPTPEIEDEANLFFSLLQKVIDDEIYLILLLHP